MGDAQRHLDTIWNQIKEKQRQREQHYDTPERRARLQAMAQTAKILKIKVKKEFE